MHPLNLLIIEDNELYAKLLDMQIKESFGDAVHVFFAASIKDTNKIFLANAIDVVILDLNLPDSSGYDTISKITEIDSTIPIIVITATDSDAVRLSSMISGADAYIQKNKDTPNWSHVILSTIDNRRKDKNRFTGVEKRLESLTTMLESLVNQIKEVNVAVFGNCTPESKASSLITQIIEIKTQLSSNILEVQQKLSTQNYVIDTIKHIWDVSLPVIIAVLVSAVCYTMFGIKAP